MPKPTEKPSFSSRWLRGVVLTPDAQPVEHFTISLFPHYAPMVSAARQQAFDDPRGEFELTMDAAGPFDVVAMAPKFTQGLLPQVALANSRDEATPVEIVLIPGGSISGLVRTIRGEPIPHALVQLGQYLISTQVGELPAEIRSSSPEQQEVFLRKLNDELKRTNPNPWTETDAAGRFILTELPQGTYPLQASHPEYVSASQQVVLRPGAQLTDVVLVLPDIRLGSLTVTVVDGTKAPIAAALIKISSMADSSSAAEVSRQADDKGITRAADLSPGLYRVTATVALPEGSTVRTAEVPVDAGQDAQVTLVFQPGAAIFGQVDRAGKPVASVPVILAEAQVGPETESTGKAPAQSASIAGHALITTATDAQGQFEAHGLPPGYYQLVVVTRQDQQAAMSFKIEPSDTRRSLAVHLATTMLRGTVRDARTQSPIAGATVHPLLLATFEDASQVDSFQASAACNVISDSQGMYTCQGVARGQYRLDVQAPGYGRAQQSLDVALPETQHDVALQLAAQLIVAVSSPQRLPLPGIYVEVASLDNPEGDVAGFTDEHGLLHWSDLEPGAYEVRFDPGSTEGETTTTPQVTPITLAPGETKRITLMK